MEGEGGGEGEGEQMGIPGSKNLLPSDMRSLEPAGEDRDLTFVNVNSF